MSSTKNKIAAWILLPVAAPGFQGQSVPLTFSSEDVRVADFAKLPPAVLTLLVHDREDFPDGPPKNLRCEDHEALGAEPQPEILCRVVKLSFRPGTDYLVIGVGDLRGAHIVPFWLFHQDETGASLLLKTRSDQIEVMRTRYDGYAEIRSTWIQGAGSHIQTTTFRFDGRAYSKFREKIERH